jgi:RNA polymerase sigma-70 factor (ECF subfamily)
MSAVEILAAPERRSGVTLGRSAAVTGQSVSGVEPQLKAMMQKSLRGDAAAYRMLLVELSGYLRAYFGRRLGPSAHEAEDLVQEVLLAIHRKRETYDVAQPFTPWVYALARYKLLDHFRRARSRPTVAIDDVGELFADQNAEEGAVRRDLDKLLGGLTPGQRALMEDVKIAGFSMAEAGARRGVSAGSARVSIHRGLQALMRKVRDEDR